MFRALAAMRCAPRHLHIMKESLHVAVRGPARTSLCRAKCAPSCGQGLASARGNGGASASGLVKHNLYNFEHLLGIDTPTGARRLDGHGPGGLVVEHSPATRETRVRFPARINMLLAW